MSRRSAGLSSIDIEAALRAHFDDLEPGDAPIGLVQRIAAIPESVTLVRPVSRLQRARPVFALAAAVVVLALIVRLAPESGLIGSGSGTPPGAPTAFDPTIDGIGLAPPFDDAGPWALTIVALVLLGVWAAGSAGRRRIPPLLVIAALGGYATYGTFVPIDLEVSGFGQGLHVTEASLPPGAQGQLYYETAQPRQPFSIGLLLIGGSQPDVRIESVADEHPASQVWVAFRWTSVWLDHETNGGMMGPDRPFAPFDLPATGQSIWLVGRAGACAVGRPPTTGDVTVGFIDSVKVNVSVLGWPRIVELPIPRIAEADTNPCSADIQQNESSAPASQPVSPSPS